MASEPKGYLVVPVWNDTGIIKALVNDTGQIPVKESDPLTSIQAQLYGYIGAGWVKAGIPLFYDSPYSERVTFTATTTADTWLESTAVAAGYVHTVQMCQCINTSNVCQRRLYIYNGSTSLMVKRDTAGGADSFTVPHFLPITMAATTYCRARFTGHTIGDSLELVVWGYKTKLT